MARHKKPEPEVIHMVQGASQNPVAAVLAQGKGYPTHDTVLVSESSEPVVIAVQKQRVEKLLDLEQIKASTEHYAKSDAVISVKKVLDEPKTIELEASKRFTPVEGAYKQTSLAQRLTEAKARLESASCVGEACYWQGVVDCIESYSAGVEMPDVIGAGVKVA